MKKFVEQSREYVGRANRFARCVDSCGEEHAIIEMCVGRENNRYYLDWIGAEYADSPDEMGECPFGNLVWKNID